VKAAIGENMNNETLGSATTHCEISGVTDYKAKDDKDALDTIKNIVGKIGDYEKAGFNREKTPKTRIARIRHLRHPPQIPSRPMI
jgi:acetyl-CoA carboxylase carboxyltransferase component